MVATSCSPQAHELSRKFAMRTERLSSEVDWGARLDRRSSQSGFKVGGEEGRCSTKA